MLFREFGVGLDELRALQLARLKQALRHAYDHQAPYRAKCLAAGVHPDDLQSLDDLGHLPLADSAKERCSTASSRF